MMKLTRVLSLNKTAVQRLALFGVLMAAGQSAYASCTVTSGYKAQVINMKLGRVLVTPNSQVGDTLATGQFPINAVNDIARCDSSGGSGIGQILQGSSSTLTNVWNTNIPGIGIRLYREAGSNSTFYPHTLRLAGNSNVSLNGGYFKIDVVKTASQTGTGQLMSGMYTTYYMDGSGAGLPMLESIVDASSLMVVTSTCNVDSGSKNKVVTLDTVTAASFDGVGSTQGEKTFDININCVGGVGENLLPGSAGQGIVNVRFNYDQDTSNAPGVIKSEPGANTASGVAVQLLTGTTTQPIKNGDAVNAGSTIPNQANALTLPLKARYYRTGTTIKGGNIKSTATFTIEYN
ncbi:Fimbrial subunit type 1 precursor [Serratia quinivorans]|uniref:fimbrial protein n=1 Tax=Serratia TaxID=613 RepID=UPI00217ABB2E|nr:MULTISPECIES: fimbrial protein [Serratia]CAI0835698.1 Fimbrial subunit type 1 precursor [Serratia quinivorans]CAI1032261.1 Fimbrial subunit type 1 precursor [Serratia quinivorans]CAI1035179.1 Fimbrial subunit type 1 precursor [Serratia quinivorans]CAI1050509.1 Fimbrial subunit type 1 precursor [Serratia quinivorans]CAI1854114.1 Fimbrial subunit type 1 precursor [Serratia quinivorans]